MSHVMNQNPYDAHPALSPLQSEVLWEYAKLAHHLNLLTQKTRSLNQQPDNAILPHLRLLEKKMGLVLTLFKASVWGVINEQPPPEPSQGYYNDSNDTTIRH